MGRPYRLLTIAKPYVYRGYRAKLEQLQRSGRFVGGLICPPAWEGQKCEAPTPDSGLWMRRVATTSTTANHLHLYRRLAPQVREFAPDIINIEEEHYSLVTWQVGRLAQRLGVPFVFYTWQNIAKRYPPPFRWTEGWVLRHAAAGVAGNQEAQSILRDKGLRGLSAVIPQIGVDASVFFPRGEAQSVAEGRRQLGLGPEDYHILYAGRLVPEKGVDTLLAAGDQLAARFDRRFVVHVAGSGSMALGNRRWLRRHGRQGLEGIAALMRAVDVLVLPSRTRDNWKEQFGRVLVEAMATGAIPVGSDSGEIPRVIDNPRCVFPEGDAAALTQILEWLGRDAAARDAARARGYRRVAESFSAAAIARQTEALLLEILDRRGVEA